MRIQWTSGQAESLTPDSSPALMAALERRGLTVVHGSEPDTDAVAGLLAAPGVSLGPDRVRAWRAWAESGRHLLVACRPAVEADCGLVLPGLEVVEDPRQRAVLEPGPVDWDVARPLDLTWRGGRIVTRGPTRVEPPQGLVPGSLNPRGGRWLSFGRTWDVLEAWPLGDGWALVQLAVGAGTVTLLSDARAFEPDVLGDVDHRRLLSRVLQVWLPSLHGHWLGTARPGMPVGEHAEPHLVGALEHGVSAEDVLVPGAPIAAVRALVEHGFIEAGSGRVRLTDAGREHRARVAAVLQLEAVLAEADRAG